MTTPRQSNRRVLVAEAVLTPATAVVFAVALHHWAGQPWWAVVPAGVVFAVATGGLRWWRHRR